MKTLIIMRHAKSSWDNVLLDDHDRTLNDRGHTAATQMGKWMAMQNLRPDYALLSSAVRVQETWAHVEDALKSGATMQTERTLYMARPEPILERFRKTDPSVETLMLVNHEPTVSALSEMLTKQPADPSCTRAFSKFPSGAVAEFHLSGSWTELRTNTCTFHRFTCPKDFN